jgi:hypothetical protein
MSGESFTKPVDLMQRETEAFRIQKREGLMSEFNDWELSRAPYIDEDRTVEVTARIWEHFETFNALEFIDEVRREIDELDAGVRRSAEIYFRTWDDVDGCPSRAVSLTYRRPATEREIRMDRARQIKSVMDDRAWLQQRTSTLLEDAERAGMSADDIGISAEGGNYVITRKAEAEQE